MTRRPPHPDRFFLATGGDLEAEVHRQEFAAYYAPMSWHVMLAGYGDTPTGGVLIDMTAVERFVGGCALTFPTHAEALARLSAA